MVFLILSGKIIFPFPENPKNGYSLKSRPETRELGTQDTGNQDPELWDLGSWDPRTLNLATDPHDRIH